MFILGIITFIIWMIPIGILLTAIKLMEKEDKKKEEK